MSKFMKIIFFILIGIILWIVLASVDAGAIGIGIILSVFAFIDVVTGKFKENEKIIWIVIILAAIMIGMIGILVKKLSDSSASLEFLFGLIPIILSLSYFIVGRRRRLK